MSISVRHSGAWRQVNADGLLVRHAGSWRTVSKGYVKHNGAWKQFHQQSDPLTFTFYPVWTSTFGEGHLEPPQYTMESENGDLNQSLSQGDWATVGHPSGMGRVYGVIRFDEVVIASAMGDRKDCTSIRVFIHNRNSYDGAVQAKIYSSTTAFTNSRPGSLGSVPQLTFWKTSAVMIDETGTWITISTSLGDQILAGTIKALILYDNGTTEVAKGKYRFIAGDETSPDVRKPQIDMTADF